MLFESVAYAMGSGSQGGQSSGSDVIVQFVPLILMFAIFWFLLIRPQQKRAKEHKIMLGALKKGDYVVTSGGMMGRILEIDADSLLLKCGEANLRLSRSSISNMYEPATKEVKVEKNFSKKSSKSGDKNKSEKGKDIAEDKKSDTASTVAEENKADTSNAVAEENKADTAVAEDKKADLVSEPENKSEAK